MLIIGIDPGTTESGYAVYRPHSHSLLESGVLPNKEMLNFLRSMSDAQTRLGLEMVASYGMPVGREVFETVLWTGRFLQHWLQVTGETPELVYRKDVKMHLCQDPRAKDGNIRQAILDLFEPTGGGANPQVGTKGKPGPLYGVSTHAWPALGVALTLANWHINGKPDPKAVVPKIKKTRTQPEPPTAASFASETKATMHETLGVPSALTGDPF